MLRAAHRLPRPVGGAPRSLEYAGGRSPRPQTPGGPSVTQAAPGPDYASGSSLDSLVCFSNAWRMAVMKSSSGTAPVNSAVSLMTVFGTPMTRYRWASSGNSSTSTTVALMCGFAMANAWAARATRGQWGQVGVTNTWIWTGVSTSRSIAAAKLELRWGVFWDRASTVAMMVANSLPTGVP